MSSGAATQELARPQPPQAAAPPHPPRILVAVAATGSVLVLTGKAVLPVASEQIYPIRYREYVATAARQYGSTPTWWPR